MRVDIESMGTDILPFPSIMSGVAGEFATIFSSFIEAPKHFFYMAFLTCLGSVLSGRLSLNLGIKTQPRLYTLLLGESADIRKSTVINKTVEFFNDIERFKTCYGVGSAEGLQRRLEKDHNVLLCLDEFRQFTGKCEVQASVLLSCVTTLFENNEYENWTKTTQMVLRNAHLSFLAASTLQTYEKVSNRIYLDIGFTNRVFIVPGGGGKKFELPPVSPDKVIHDLKFKLQKIINKVGYELKFDLTDQARALYKKWYFNIDDEHSFHSKRLDTYAMKFMSLLALNESKEIVDTAIVEKVTQLCNWQLRNRQLYDPIEADSKIGKLEEKIRRVLQKKPRTERELKQYTNARGDSLWYYDAAKKNLNEGKEIIFLRSKKVWALSESMPDLQEDWTKLWDK